MENGKWKITYVYFNTILCYTRHTNFFSPTINTQEFSNKRYKIAKAYKSERKKITEKEESKQQKGKIKKIIWRKTLSGDFCVFSFVYIIFAKSSSSLHKRENIIGNKIKLRRYRVECYFLFFIILICMYLYRIYLSHITTHILFGFEVRKWENILALCEYV